MAANHPTDSSRDPLARISSQRSQTAPMNTAEELIANFRDSPTKKINPRLKHSVTSLICSEQSKLLILMCDGAQLNSDVRTLNCAYKIFLKPTVQQYIASVESSATFKKS